MEELHKRAKLADDSIGMLKNRIISLENILSFGQNDQYDRIIAIHKQDEFPLFAILASELGNAQNVKFIAQKKATETSATIVPQGYNLKGDLSIARFLAYTHGLDGKTAYQRVEVENWISFGINLINVVEQGPKALNPLLKQLDTHLTLRTFSAGYSLTLADIVLYVTVKQSAKSHVGVGKFIDNQAFNLKRFLRLIANHNGVKEFDEKYFPCEGNQNNNNNKNKKKNKKKNNKNNNNDKNVDNDKEKTDEIDISEVFGIPKNIVACLGWIGKNKIPLEGAEVGKVVTRFPPEPSGYLHVGHAKALFLNWSYAKQWKGKLLLRFDDTNPDKEKKEYVDGIMEDLATLGVEYQGPTYTSDYFETIREYAIKLLKEGHAYIDFTPPDKMKEMRDAGIECEYRNNTVEQNLEYFKEMCLATEQGSKCVMRAKMDMSNPVKCLRDPSLYRVLGKSNHYRTGDKYKAYPLYDLACPIVDSIEGVTHALRTNEYRDRNALYDWVIEKCGLRKVHIKDYARLNFAYTLLSKRKLNWFVETKRVSGWDSPAFPTVRGLVRRGLQVDVLKGYVISQGSSQKTTLQDINKLWSINRKAIDGDIPRHSAISVEKQVDLILNDDIEPSQKVIPKHKKNPGLGQNVIHYQKELIIEYDDAVTLSVDEEITLYDWGNIIIREIIKDPETALITTIRADLHLQGDYRKTKKKINWLANNEHLVDVVLHEYDFLINKTKLSEGDSLQDYMNDPIEQITICKADANVRTLQKSQSIQLLRRGYFKVDTSFVASHSPVHLVYIPHGHNQNMSIIKCKVPIRYVDNH